MYATWPSMPLPACLRAVQCHPAASNGTGFGAFGGAAAAAPAASGATTLFSFSAQPAAASAPAFSFTPAASSSPAAAAGTSGGSIFGTHAAFGTAATGVFGGWGLWTRGFMTLLQPAVCECWLLLGWTLIAVSCQITKGFLLQALGRRRRPSLLRPCRRSSRWRRGRRARRLCSRVRTGLALECRRDACYAATSPVGAVVGGIHGKPCNSSPCLHSCSAAAAAAAVVVQGRVCCTSLTPPSSGGSAGGGSCASTWRPPARSGAALALGPAHLCGAEAVAHQLVPGILGCQGRATLCLLRLLIVMALPCPAAACAPQARLVMRQRGNLRLLLNANLWAEMHVTKLDGGKVG